jgi:hypothetical protein
MTTVRAPWWGTLTLAALLPFSLPVVTGARQKSAKQPNPSASKSEPALTSFPVHVLPTSQGMPDAPAPEYPKTVRLPAGAFANQISAYGASGEIWIGPKGWTGTGSIGVDGNVFVELHPENGSADSGPRIRYVEIPACVSCMESEAAPYFPKARKTYNASFRSDSGPITIPQGLKPVPLSPTLLTWSLPDKNGLLVRGVAYYDGGQYVGARFLLAPKQRKLTSFLEQSFIARKNLK